MREFFILLLAVLLWSLAFLVLYRRQVRKAGSRETVSLLRRLFWGKGCCWEEGNYSVLLLYLVSGRGLFFRLYLAVFPVPDYYGLLLLLFMAGGVFLAGGTFPSAGAGGWERIHSLPEGYAVFLATLNRPGTGRRLDWRHLVPVGFEEEEPSWSWRSCDRGRMIVFLKGQEVLAAGDRLLILGRKTTTGGRWKAVGLAAIRLAAIGFAPVAGFFHIAFSGR